MINGHYIKSWSKGQSVIALSSAEAELYGIIKTASECLGLMSIMQDWGIVTKATLYTDASAAIGVLGRSGLGKLRHIDTSYLWLQQESIKRKLVINKILGTINPADMHTKALPYDSIVKHITTSNMQFEEGRSELAPELNQFIHKLICKRFNTSITKVTKRNLSGL